MVIIPVATPSRMSIGTSRRRIVRSEGRAIAHRNTVPQAMRSSAVPAGPTLSMTKTEKAFVN